MRAVSHRVVFKNELARHTSIAVKRNSSRSIKLFIGERSDRRGGFGTVRGKQLQRLVFRNCIVLFCVAGIHLVYVVRRNALRLAGGNAARDMEPELFCVAALWSPSTGIIDGHAYMLALQGDIESRGGAIAFDTPVERLSTDGKTWQVAFGGKEPGTLDVDAVVNSAGLRAQALAHKIEGYPTQRIPRLVLAKGNYFSYAGRPVFSRLIYPTPVDGGLGVHVTLDLAGRMRFGPDVQWIEEEDYNVDPGRAASFYARIRTYWPSLADDTLIPDYCGIRPKLTGPGQPPADFMIDTPADHKMPGLVNLFGIESPGLTSSLSLADEVVSYLEN